MPQTIGRYELLRPIGSGGMGEVLLARDPQLGRNVALKRVLAGDDPAAQRRILHEARALAHLNHPHIAAVFDVVDHESGLHLVMEFVEGETLAARLRRGPLPEAAAIAIGRQVADALAAAHGQGVLHCDIKPSNVMITSADQIKVLDFGVSRFDPATDSAGTRTTTSGQVRGTPPYMAPEVLLGAPPSAESDVYSLGVMLFELLSGRRPFDGRDGAAVLLAATSPAPPLSEVAPGVSAALSGVVSRAIAADPAQRYRSAVALKAALDEVSETVPWRWASRPLDWTRVAAPAAGLLLACAALVLGLTGTSGAPSPPPSPQVVVGVMIFNDTGDAANDYLTAGVTDVIVSRLVSARGLSVVPRSAVLPYLTNAAAVPAGIRELGLTHALTGGVQKSGPALRLTLGLVGGAQGVVLWSATFDGAAEAVFPLQQRAADAAARALRAEGLVPAGALAQARTRPPTASEDAFEDYANGRVMLERADVAGNLDRAISFFERAVTRDQAFVRAHAALGEAAWAKYRATRDVAWIDRARAATLAALRLDPDDPSVRFSLAVIDHGTGRVDEAIEDLQRVLEQQPASDEAYRLLGRIYSERRDFDRAIAAFREAERIRPAYPATVRSLGLAYYDRGSLAEAIATFTRLTAMQPDNAANFQMLGTAHHAAGELDRALAAYERTNTIAPRATAYSNIGIIHHTNGDYQKAVDAYRRAIGLQPKEAVTHRNLADALWMTGDRAAARREYDAAIDLSTQALKVNAAQPRVHALIAFCHAKLGRFEAAQQSLDLALAQAPDDNEVIYKQAVIETLAGKRDEARATLARAVQLGYSRSRLDADRDLDPLRPLPQSVGAR